VERLEFTIRRSDASKPERSSTEIIPASALQRPVVAILDTGLTGCICSDSLYHELFGSRRDFDSAIVVKGATVTLPTIGGKAMELPSFDEYWQFSSFRLPWFDDEERHPHIIALGSTFWANTDSLVIDVDSQRAKIIPTGK
jgi:hypothetical protein